MTTLTRNLNEQLFQELDNKVAENLNGGYEVFTIANQTRANVAYSLDGSKFLIHKPNQVLRFATNKGGIINFDQDVRTGVIDYKKYNLANKRVYAFRDNKSTRGNPYDIDLYRIG